MDILRAFLQRSAKTPSRRPCQLCRRVAALLGDHFCSGCRGHLTGRLTGSLEIADVPARPLPEAVPPRNRTRHGGLRTRRFRRESSDPD